MGIFERLDSILKANINALFERAEDPAKMIDQTLRELYEDLAEVKENTANVMADERAARRRLDNCKEEIDKAVTAAQNALKAGNEGDARKIITKKQQLEENLAAFKSQYELAHSNSEKMQAAHDKLVSDIESLNNRKDSIKAKIATAKAQEHINEMTAGVDTSSSIEAFDRWEEKANKMMDAAYAKEELNKGDATEDIVEKYTVTNDADVDAELENMKKKLGL